MRYEPADPQLFVHNREQLTAKLPANSLVIVHSNDIYPTNADGVLPFYQNSDLYYLSGADQEETTLILNPSAENPADREILFVLETSESIAIWEGEKLTKEKATALTGIQRIEWLDQFESIYKELAACADHVYLPANDHPRAVSKVQTAQDRFALQFKQDFPNIETRALSELLYPLRVVKHPVEIEKIQTACDITEKGFRRVLGFIRPGVGEWEIEAEFAHEFIRNRSKGFAYTPIIGSGANANILHYIQNNTVVQDGDLILMDVGAEYANWNADMTRCVPASGTFTERQKEVYNAVLRTMRYADSILRPGLMPKDYQAKVVEFIEEELIDLGLFTKQQAAMQDETKSLVKKYFMHGTSHHLGLDVHDVSPKDNPFAVGNVVTIEPGIYIREENIGIRLENNFVIGENGNTDLMANIPLEIDDIEALMAARQAPTQA